MTSFSSSSALDIEFAGQRFKLDPAGGADIVAQTIAAGAYEAPLPIMIAAMVCRLPGMFLDIGANNGVYSMIVASVAPDKRIMAFEPFPPIVELLRKNIALNDLNDRVEVVEAALSDEDGEATIYLPDPRHGLIETSASLEAGFSANSTPNLTVPTKRLDSIQLPDAVCVAKVDIEGFELEFLRGATETIKRDRPIIFAEMLECVDHKFAEITRIMGETGYLLFRLRPDQAIQMPWVTFDMQAWNYCLLPREKLHVFREACAFHGLEILAPA